MRKLFNKIKTKIQDLYFRTKAKIKVIIIALLLGGGMFAGNQVGRPECDYVIITDNAQEICLSMEQVKAIYRQMEKTPVGFGSINFGGSLNIVEKK